MEHPQHGLMGAVHIFLDVDHVIHHYKSPFARQFSVATAESFCELYPHQAARSDIDELISMSVLGYATKGRTTAIFGERYGADEMLLYRHHHDALCERGGYIDQQFRKGRIELDPQLSKALQKVKEAGVTLYALTNGTENYARTVLGERGHNIAGHFSKIMGMDSFGPNQEMLDKRHGAHLMRALKHCGITNPAQCILVDDSPCNLTAFRKIGGYTVLPMRRNPTTKQDRRDVHLVVSDIKDFLNRFAASERGHSPARRRSKVFACK